MIGNNEFNVDAFPHRLTTKIKDAVFKPLVTVTAPYGYRKSSLAKELISGVQNRAWVELTSLDNDADIFWDHFINVLKSNEFGKSKIGHLPRTNKELLTFKERYFCSPSSGRRKVVVFSGYERLTNPKILAFIKALVGLLDNAVGMIVISKKNNDLYATGLRSNVETTKFTKDDLCLDDDDIETLLEKNDVPLSAGNSQALRYATDGWPYAVAMAINQMKGGVDVRHVDFRTIYDFFDAKFRTYDPDYKKLLVLAAQTPDFPVKVLKKYDITIDKMFVTQLISDIYIKSETHANQYRFMKIYRDFLVSKSYIVDDKDIKAVTCATGKVLEKEGEYIHAIECYRVCHDYKLMIGALMKLPLYHTRISTAQTVLDCLDTTSDAHRGETLRSILRSIALMNQLKNDEAYDVLTSIENPIDDYLCDINILLGTNRMIAGDDNFLNFFKIAYDNRNLGTRLMQTATIDPGILLPFFYKLADGAVKRMDGSIQVLADYLRDLIPEVADGIQLLFRSNVHYARLELNKAEEYGYKMIHKGQETKNHFLICSGYGMLIRTSLQRGDLTSVEKWRDQLDSTTSYTPTPRLIAIKKSLDCQFDLWLKNNDKLQTYFDNELNQCDLAPAVQRRILIRYATFLLENDRLNEVPSIIDRIYTTIAHRGTWLFTIDYYILKSIYAFEKNDHQGAIDNMYHAYKLTYKHGFVTPFIEYGTMMRNTMTWIRSKDDPRFDIRWINTILSKSSSFAKRTTSLINEISNKNQKSKVTLPKSELEVLKYLSQGFTLSEIADIRGVTINTVKTQTKSIYNRLGSVNRADAIHNATSLGLL